MRATPLWNLKAAVGILLSALLVASSVRANTTSDFNDGADVYTDVVVAYGVATRVYGSADDWCYAVDSDGPGNDPVGDDASCDNNDTDTVSTVNGPGDPTGLVGLFFPNCVDSPNPPPGTGFRTDCDNGTFGIADDNGGDGSDGLFGGDYPNATEVEISVAVGQVAIVVQVGYRDPWATTGGTSNPTVFTGISTTVCIGLGATYKVKVGGVGTQAATDPPAAQTIVSVFVGRVSTVGTCGNTPGGNTPKTITMTWTYATQVNDSTVTAAVTVTPDVGGLTCTITFDNSASVYTAGGEGRWGAVGSSIMIGPSNQYGDIQSEGPSYGAAGAWAGTVLAKAVHTQEVSWAVWAWAIEGNYTVAFGTIPCVNPFTPFSEPACTIIVVDGLATAPPGGPLCLPPGMATCTPAVDTGLAGLDCVAPYACAPNVVSALANGVGGAARARVWCDENGNGVHDGDPFYPSFYSETKADAPITGAGLDVIDLQSGYQSFGDYHCTLTWAPTFTGALACWADAPGVSTPPSPPPGSMTERVLLHEEGIGVESQPGQEIPDVPPTPGQDVQDVPPTLGQATPDVPPTPGQPVPDHEGVGPVPTPPVGQPIGVVSTRDAGANYCLYFTPEGGAEQEVACVGQAFLGPAGPLLPRGSTQLLFVDPPDVPATGPIVTPDVPPTPGQPIPDVPPTPGQATPDVPPTPGQETPDVPATPAVTLDLDVSYRFDGARLTPFISVLGHQTWSPVGPTPQDAQWLADPANPANLTFMVTVYKDGVQQGTVSHWIPALGQALAAALRSAGAPP